MRLANWLLPLIPGTVFALLAPFAIVHVEVRYQIPLKLLGLLASMLFSVVRAGKLADPRTVEISPISDQATGVLTVAEKKRIAGKIVRRLLRRNLSRPAPTGELHAIAEAREWVLLEERGRAVMAASPADGESMSLVAFALQQQGRFDEGATLAAEAVRISPHNLRANFIAGVSLQSLGKHDEAYTFLRRAHDLAPSEDQATLRLVEVIAALRGLEAAAAEYLETARLLAREVSVLNVPVRRVEDWAQEVGLKLLPAGEVEEIPFVPPRLWGQPPAHETTIALSNKPYVADIANARIFSHSSLILTSDGVVLSDSGADPRFGHAVSFVYESIVLAQRSGRVLITLDNMDTREIEAGIFLAGLASDYYGHWVPEFLPKLQFLQHHPNFRDLPIIVDANLPQSHLDHLRRLVDNDLILLDARQSLICGRLLVAPSPTFFPVELFPNDILVEEMPGLSPRAMRYFRGAERPSQVRRPVKKVFLARKAMRWRRLLNEEEIERMLAGLGFETVLMESLSAAEQIELFAQAEWIVAPNGSALLNLVFADTAVKLLVLTQPNLFNWGTFQGPMGELGYDTWCLQGEYAVSESQKHSDYRISVDRLRAALAGMGLSGASQSATPASGN